MTTPKTPELLGRATSSFGAALLAVLVPKCPLCIAAYLAALGLGATAAHSAALFVRPIVFALAGVALFSLGLGLWRSRHRRAAPGCCGHSSSH